MIISGGFLSRKYGSAPRGPKRRAGKARRREHSGKGRLTLAAVGALCAATAMARGLAGQAPPNIAQARLAYQATVSEAEAARLSLEARDGQWTEVMDSLAAIRARGDDARLTQWFARAETLAGARSTAAERFEERTGAAQAAGGLLAAVLDQEIERLVAASDTASAGSFRDINAIVGDLEIERDQLVRESTVTVQVVALSSITIDPIDGPDDIIAKAELLEHRARQANENILDIDDQLGTLRERERFNRSRRDNLSELGRFDDNRLPVGPAGRGPDPVPVVGVAPGDSSAARRPRPIEDQIRGLERLRSDLESFRDQLSARAVSFRNVAGEDA